MLYLLLGVCGCLGVVGCGAIGLVGCCYALEEGTAGDGGCCDGIYLASIEVDGEVVLLGVLSAYVTAAVVAAKPILHFRAQPGCFVVLDDLIVVYSAFVVEAHDCLDISVEAVVAHRLKGYEPYKGDIERRTNGSLVSLETGLSVAYSMDKLQDRGRFFIEPGVEIYEGQVVGEHTRERDLTINICKTKKLTNMRASGSDDKVMLPPPIVFSLEEALEYIQEDELVEVTPKSMRLRKILLSELDRKRKSSEINC